MTGKVVVKDEQKLSFHLQKFLEEERRFENVYQSLLRMILEEPIEKITRGGKTLYDFKVFRKGKKHPVGWYEEFEAFVTHIKEAAEGGAAKEKAFVWVGPPGNGKTFTVDYICKQYREFILKKVGDRRPNLRYTFEFVNLEDTGLYGDINVIQSQTFEDPMILAMNLFPTQEESIDYLQRKFNFPDEKIEEILTNYRPLGACSQWIWRDILEHVGDVEKALEDYIRVLPQPISEEMGVLTTKYAAGDKITASKVDLVGEEDPTIRLQLTDRAHPYKIDLRIGTLARAGGGGIHFADEIFKNKIDLMNVYLQLIQPRAGEVRHIENLGYKWPIDTFIIATTNDEEYNRFISEQGQGPIKDRCTVYFVGYLTDYKLQKILVGWELAKPRRTYTGKKMHIDPNLSTAVSLLAALTRVPQHAKLNPVEMVRLEAGESAGDKDLQALAEVKDEFNSNIDVSRRWGQKGLSQREVDKAIELLSRFSTSHENECMCALDIFDAAERVIKDYVINATDRDLFLSRITDARKLYKKAIKTSIYNAYREDPEATPKDVMAYVNMIVALASDKLGSDNTLTRVNPKTGKLDIIKIDETYVNAVEERLGLKTKESKEEFRSRIRSIYSVKIMEDPNYNFMDDERLVEAVTSVKTETSVAAASSLMGTLYNRRANVENMKEYNRILKIMMDQQAYCEKCAERTIDYWCTKQDE